MTNWFDFDDIDKMDEFVGCKLECEYDKTILKFTQPVLLQKN